MKEEIKDIELVIAELQAQITSRRQRIEEIYKQCQHAWMEPKCIYHRVQYGESHYSGSYDSHHWERECEVCGKKETTYRENMLPVPDFGSNDGKITLPNFGG